MNSIGIDTLLKSPQGATSSSASTKRNPANGEFEGYLREATTTVRQSGEEQPADTAKRSPDATVSSHQEQGSNNSPEEQPAQVVELGESTSEESSNELQNDEVIISVVATATHDQVPTQVEVLPGVATATTTDFDTTATSTVVAAPDVLTAEAAANASHGTDMSPPLPETLEDAALPSTAAISLTVDATTTTPADVPPQEIAHLPEQPSATEKTLAEPIVVDNSPVPRLDPAQFDPSGVDGEIPGELVAKTTIDTPSTTSPNSGSITAPSVTQEKSPSQATMAPPADESGGQMPTIDRARFVQRVANAFRSAQQNDGQIQLRLSPPELGTLRLEIAVRNGVLTANLETETTEARRVILDNLPALRQRLAEQEIRIEKFDVDVRREGNHSDGQAGAQDRQAQQQSQRTAAHNRIRTTPPADVVATNAGRLQSAGSNSGLDVRV